MVCSLYESVADAWIVDHFDPDVQGGQRRSMALQPGATLGPYGIRSPIGAGGDGEVYRARDPRLNRETCWEVYCWLGIRALARSPSHPMPDLPASWFGLAD
jgi:hypothetical protein